MSKKTESKKPARPASPKREDRAQAGGRYVRHGGKLIPRKEWLEGQSGAGKK